MTCHNMSDGGDAGCVMTTSVHEKDRPSDA